MGTIPVGQSIGGAYGFLFRRFLTILSLSWLPAAIYAVGRLGFLWHVEPDIFAAVDARTHPSIFVCLIALGYVLFAVLMKAVVALPLNRDALDMRDQPVLARFVIGVREVRLFAAYIRIVLILIALIIALVAGVIGVTIGAKWALAQGVPVAGWPVLKIVHVVASVSAILIFLFVALRLSFLIAPVAAVEDSARLWRAWALSAGNFWRMLVVFLALVVPLLILVSIGEYAVMGTALHDAARIAITEHNHGAILAAVLQHGPALVTIAAIFLVIANALFAGAAATAYRALVPQPRRETEVYVAPIETQAHGAHEPAPVPHAEEAAPVAEEPHIAEEAPHDAHAEAEHHEVEHHEPEHHEAEHHEAEHHAEAGSSHEEPAHEPVVELHEPAVQEEAHEPPHPEVPEDPGAHVH